MSDQLLIRHCLILFHIRGDHHRQTCGAEELADGSGKFGWACGFFGNDWVFPANRLRTSAAWVAENWRASLAWYWIEGTENSASELGPIFFGVPPEFITPAIPSIGSKSYIDLDINYELSDNLTLGLTVANLLDEGPAFMADNGNQANTETEMYDVFGRAYTLRLSLNY